MSCNTFIPIMDLVREVEALLAANYIDKDDPRITGGVFTNPTIKEGFLLDVQAREEFCRLVQECGLDAPFGKMWLSRPLYPDQMFVSYEDSGEPQTKWKTIQAVLESAGVFGPEATSLSSRLASEIDRATTAENEIILRAEEADVNIAANEESIATNATAISAESSRAVAAEGVLTSAVDALELKDLSLQSQVNSIGGGKKAYTTYALMAADKDNIDPNSSIDVTNDTDPLKNGTYSYDGAVFTKSIYDPLTQAKAYADANKVAISDISTQYLNGNMIGSKTSRLTNKGITNLYALTTGTIYASVVLNVSASDVLFIHNTSNDFVAGNGGIYAFFAENPATNTTQTRILHTAETVIDSASSIKYQKVTVPAGAKYLLLNTKYGSNNYEWAVHQDKFSASYETGTDEVVVAIKGNQIKGSDDLRKSVDYVDGRLVNYNEVKISTKNLFNPESVITGSTYNNTGGLYYGGGVRRTIKYPCTAGEWIAISGLSDRGTLFQAMHFWDSSGIFVSVKYYPAVASTTAFTIQAPASAAFFSLNLNGSSIPPKLQIEKSPVVTAYEPYRIPFIATMPNYVDIFSPKTSSKNLYDGGLNVRYRTIGTGAQSTGSDDDVISSLIPVQSGKTYTISGINPALMDSGYRRILGYKNNTDSLVSAGSNFTTVVGWISGSSTTITITDEETKYITIPLSSQGFGTLAQAKSLSLQVEEGSFATSYEPYQYSAENLQLYNASVNIAKTAISAISSKSVGTFTEMDRGRGADSNVVKFEKRLAPTGISYSVTSTADSGTNNLYAKATGVQAGTRVISANLMKTVGGATALPTLKNYPFTVPSGQLDNPDTLSTYANNQMNKYNYCHPDIAYSSTPIAGFKYWMVSSILPPYNMNDTQWEDEDVFVSNDAKTWQRVRSLYETDKTYTTAELRLPPHNLAQANARRYGLLPCPASGDTIEISVPADNGAAALERVNIKLTGLPWKHDPAILIDGGYVYIYHSYHLPYVDRDGGKNRFIVCTRTSNGIDWDVVRSDGSTMRITAENSRTLFTKSADGKYNYLYYAYSRGYSNPTVIKYGANDYELIYGENYSFRIKGTTPYNFDFSVQHPLQNVGSGNHPMAFYDGTSKTYIINNDNIYESTDRGVSFTKLAHYPAWVGGIAGYGYKKSLCVGEGGKVILVDTQRYALSSIAPDVSGNTTTLSDNMMFIYEYPSLTDFINKANNGLVDAYVDFQLCKVNAVSGTRIFKVINAVGIKSINTNPNNPLQKIDLVNMDFKDGDVLHIYATLTSRNGATVTLGGIDIL